MRISKIKNDNILLLTIVGAIIICFTPLFHAFTGRVVSDNMGCLRLVMKIAGYKSDFDSDAIPYYGQMYYIFFFPIFKTTSNPYVLYKWIIVVNAFVRMICSVFIYKIQTLYLEIDKLPAMILTLIAMQCFPQNAITRFSNETPLFFLLSISIYIILLTKNDSGTKNNLIKIFCIVICGYGLLIHTRWILFIVSATISVIACDWLYHKRLPSLKILIFGGAVFFLYKLIAKEITVLIYGTADVHNSTLNLGTYAHESVISLLGAVITIASNFYRLCILTYGIPIIGVLIFSVILIRMFYDKSKVISTITYNQMLVFITAGLCLAGSLLGMVVYYGTPVSEWLNTGEVSDLLSGLGYERYYIMYAGFFIIGTYSIWDKVKYHRIFNLAVIVFFAALFFYLYTQLYDSMGGFKNLYYFSQFDLGRYANAEITFWGVFKVFILLIIFSNYNRQWYVLAVVLCINILGLLNKTNTKNIDITFEEQYNSAYSFICTIDENYKIYNLFTDVYQVQYALINRKVSWLDEKSINDAEFIYTNLEVNIDNHLYDMDNYYVIEVDQDERLLVKDKNKYEVIQRIVNKETDEKKNYKGSW